MSDDNKVVTLKPRSIRVNLPFAFPPSCGHDPGTDEHFHCEICSDPNYVEDTSEQIPQETPHEPDVV